MHAEVLQLWRDAGDRRGEVCALTSLGLVADEHGAPQRAATLLQEALELARAGALFAEALDHYEARG